MVSRWCGLFALFSLGVDCALGASTVDVGEREGGLGSLLNFMGVYGRMRGVGGDDASQVIVVHYR